MKRVIDSIAHLFKYKGKFVAWYEGDVMMIGFRCPLCGELTEVEPASTFISSGRLYR